jgi:hypothetical protein
MTGELGGRPAAPSSSSLPFESSGGGSVFFREDGAVGCVRDTKAQEGRWRVQSWRVGR